MNVNTLKALLMFAGKKDVRYYLNGVSIDHVKRLAIATNGQLILAVKLAPDDYANASVIITREAVENAVKIKNGQMMIEADGRVKLGCMESTPIDGRYPDWLRAVPEKTSGIAGNYNPELVNTIQEAARLILGNKNYVILLNQNGMASATVSIGDEAIAAVAAYHENAVNFSERARQMAQLHTLIRKDMVQS